MTMAWRLTTRNLLLLLIAAGLLVSFFVVGPSSESAAAIGQQQPRCKPLDNIFFLKTHKCGSSTVQNILMRRGLGLGLNFVLPENYNYLGHPEPFEIGQIDPKVMDAHGSFNIFAHHSRFNPQNVHQVMPDDTRFVSIVRQPWALFESLFNYYNVQEHLFQNQFNLKSLLALPLDEIDQMFKGPRLGLRIGMNQMAFDFGFSSRNFKDEAQIDELLRMIDAEFDLVMVAEYMEVSLVLLADLMCWPLEQVTFQTLNARPAKSMYRTILSGEEKKKIMALNNVDQRIYDHFRRRLKEKVLEFGVERMMAEATRLATLNVALLNECVELTVAPRNNTENMHYYPVNRYQLHDDAPQHCHLMVLSELKFTDMLRDLQRKRFALRADLDLLLHT